MSKKATYQQCKLTKQDMTRTTYLPKKFAVVGETVKLLLNDEWSDGWLIESTHGCVDEPPNVRKEIKAHKDNTGDSLKKA